MGYIYKITNQVNGKMYIGKTEYTNPLKRWKSHIEDSKRNKDKHRPLYNAMRKYGIDKFKFEVIDQEDNSDALCELEKKYIEEYRTYVGYDDCNGYNATLGGDGKCRLKFDEYEVIKIHKINNYIVGYTAKYYGVDIMVIKKILSKHNVPWLSSQEINAQKFMASYGGVVQINNDKDMIINIYDTPASVIASNPAYTYDQLLQAYTPKKSHKYKGSYWYRLNELPEKYKPLLEKYYKTHNIDSKEDKDI